MQEWLTSPESPFYVEGILKAFHANKAAFPPTGCCDEPQLLLTVGGIDGSSYVQ